MKRLEKNIFRSNILSAGVLLCVESVFLVTFWRAGNALTSLCCALAGLGWLAWWIEYTASPGEEGAPAGSETVGVTTATLPPIPPNTTLFETESGASFGAVGTAPPAMTPHAENADSLDGAASQTERALEITAPRADNPVELAVQVRTALADSEQGITAAIDAFLKIAGDTRQMADCAGEMTHWRLEENPLLQTAVAHLLGCSQAVSESIGGVVTAMQFQDLLRQRLEHVAACLDTMQAVARDEAGEQDRISLSRKQAA